MQKELATEKETFISNSGTQHEFSTNKKMNQFMLGLLLKTGQLSPKHDGHVLDYDNQFIPTGKYDLKRSYKKGDGYFPRIASMGNLPVYIEGCNGNSNVKYKQDQTPQRTFEVLEEGKIKIAHGRMDCGSFTKDVVSVLEANTSFFYVRAQRCTNLHEIVAGIHHWQTREIGHKEYQLASIEYAPFGGRKAYRYVISREKKTNAQGNLFTGNDFTSRAMMTNNREMTDLEVINFYNDRGNSERLFDEMNNDFLWKKMPFSFLQENTVFLIMMGICRNLYHFLTGFISKKLDFIKPNYRLKKFIFRFMAVPAKWIKRGRQWILKPFTNREYHPLLE
ncbi:transposase [Gillisia sp. Hel_I_86]|uniref:transposase n=1 Tax=Gillisia sp. Hel_I_86 TaxID=1249981 RepID=UPI0011A36E65|nr:transposase [Gillisia sp. Hel_I_86]